MRRGVRPTPEPLAREFLAFVRETKNTTALPEILTELGSVLVAEGDFAAALATLDDTGIADTGTGAMMFLDLGASSSRARARARPVT